MSSESFTLIYAQSGERKEEVTNISKFLRLVDELINCGNPNQQIIILKNVLKNQNLSEINELIGISSSNSHTNTFKYSFTLINII